MYAPLNGGNGCDVGTYRFRCVRRLFNVQIFPNTYGPLLNDGNYFVASSRLACIPLNGRKWLRCRDVPIRCVRRLFNVQTFSDTYRSLFNDGYYFVASVLCGNIRRPVEQTDAPAGTSLHPASQKTHPSRVWGGGYFDTSARFGMHPIERPKMVAM